MDKVSEITERTIAALMRDYTIWIVLSALLLAFALYVKLAGNPWTQVFAQPFVNGPARDKIQHV
jgi:hypothetical protein